MPRAILKCIELNENENTTYQNLWGTAKIVLGGKCILLNVNIKTEEKPQINKPTLKNLDKEEQNTSKARRWKYIVIKAEVNEIQNRKIIETISEAESLFLEKFKEKEKIQSTNPRNETDHYHRPWRYQKD